MALHATECPRHMTFSSALLGGSLIVPLEMGVTCWELDSPPITFFGEEHSMEGLWCSLIEIKQARAPICFLVQKFDPSNGLARPAPAFWNIFCVLWFFCRFIFLSFYFAASPFRWGEPHFHGLYRLAAENFYYCCWELNSRVFYHWTILDIIKTENLKFP